jgi:hypothetical protein
VSTKNENPLRSFWTAVSTAADSDAVGVIEIANSLLIWSPSSASPESLESHAQRKRAKGTNARKRRREEVGRVMVDVRLLMGEVRGRRTGAIQVSDIRRGTPNLFDLYDSR